MPEDYDLPPTVAEHMVGEAYRLAVIGSAPIELIIFWCFTCNSTFIHDVGSRHIPQTIRESHICMGTLIPLQFVR